MDGDWYPREARSEGRVDSPTGLWANCSWFLKLGELGRTLLGPFHENDTRPDTIDRSRSQQQEEPSHVLTRGVGQRVRWPPDQCAPGRRALVGIDRAVGFRKSGTTFRRRSSADWGPTGGSSYRRRQPRYREVRGGCSVLDGHLRSAVSIKYCKAVTSSHAWSHLQCSGARARRSAHALVVTKGDVDGGVDLTQVWLWRAAWPCALGDGMSECVESFPGPVRPDLPIECVL